MKDHSEKDNRERSNESLPKPYEPVKMKMFEFESPFKDVDRGELLDAFREAGKDAKERLEVLFPELVGWFERYDACYLLSFCAVYFLSSPEGIDKEAFEGRLDFYHHHLELLQALSLTVERSYTGEPLKESAQRLQESMQELSTLWHMAEFAVLEDPTDEDLAKSRVLAGMRAQTAAIRNWAYPEQLSRVTLASMQSVEEQFKSTYELDPEKLLQALERVGDTIEDRLNDHLQAKTKIYHAEDLEDLIQQYCRDFPDVSLSQDEAEKILDRAGGDLEQVKMMMIFHSDLFLQDIFTVSLDEVVRAYGDEGARDALRRMMDRWSLEFGDLAGERLEYLVLDNSTHEKPFIKLEGGEYFSSIYGIIHHLLPLMMESAVVDIGRETRERYLAARGKYLEDRTEELFRDFFPSASVHRGSIWSDPISGKEYENDILIVLDSFVLVVECKAGLVDPPARRGAELRLIDTLEDLVVHAGQQANRFIGFMEEHRTTHRFRTHGSKINEVDLSDARYFVPLSVTYEQMGFLSSNLKEARRAGLISELPDPMVPSICVTDLEVIFELLRNEVEGVHYFVRRAQFEADMNYLGDELDLLALYLDIALNLGEQEEAEDLFLNLGMKSKELDPYFVGKERGVEVDKPELDLSEWWHALIQILCVRKPQGWLEMGFVLLNVMRSDQDNLENELRKLLKRVRAGAVEQKHNWVIVKTAPASRAYAVACFPYLDVSKEERNNMLQYILAEIHDEHDLKGAVCIGLDARNPGFPYDVIAYYPAELF